MPLLAIVSELAKRNALGVEKRDSLCLARECLEGPGKPRGQLFSDPEDESGVRQRGRLAGPELERMRIGARFEKHVGCPHLAHDL